MKPGMACVLEEFTRLRGTQTGNYVAVFKVVSALQGICSAWRETQRQCSELSLGKEGLMTTRDH